MSHMTSAGKLACERTVFGKELVSSGYWDGQHWSGILQSCSKLSLIESIYQISNQVKLAATRMEERFILKKDPIHISSFLPLPSTNPSGGMVGTSVEVCVSGTPTKLESTHIQPKKILCMHVLVETALVGADVEECCDTKDVMGAVLRVVVLS